MKHSKIYQKALMLANEPVHCLTLEEARERVGVLSAALLYRRDRLESAAEAVAKLSEGCSIVLDIERRDVMEIWPFTSRPQIEVLGSGSVPDNLQGHQLDHHQTLAYQSQAVEHVSPQITQAMAQRHNVSLHEQYQQALSTSLVAIIHVGHVTN